MAEEMEENPIGAYQHIFNPTNNFILPNRSRKNDITVNRLRLLQTKLNAGLYKLGLHQTGLCEMCNVEESCQHMILYCKKTENLRIDIRQSVPTVSKPWDYKDYLSNPKVVDIIINYIRTESIII